jgi:PKD repeat protein
MHIITPYNPWAPKKKKTWQEEAWEQQAIAEAEARFLAEASSRTLPDNAPAIAEATAGPMVNAQAGGGGVPIPAFFNAVGGLPDFSGTPLTAVAPFTVQFTNLTPNNSFDTHLWNFGDGTTSTAKDPSHVFNTGSFDVTLTETYSDGTSTSSLKAAYISGSIPVVTAKFTYVTSSWPAPVTANFTNTSTNTSVNPTTTYKWTLGNGQTTTLASPSTVYQTGSFTASLEATGSYGKTSYTSSLFYVPAPVLAVSFTYTTSSNTAPASASFNGASGYNGSGTVNYLWTFGSGSGTSTSVSANTVYTAPGGYTASLQVTESLYNISSYTSSMFFLS